MATRKSPRLHSTFQTRISCAKMPSNCWGGNDYVHVGVVQRWAHGPVNQLRDTSEQKVLFQVNRLYYGTSGRSAGEIAERTAKERVKRYERQYAERLAAGYVQHLAERSDEI